jgi:hypothetical protein
MSRDEIDGNEKDAYLAWRRAIAAIEEGQSQVLHQRAVPFSRFLNHFSVLAADAT